MSLSQQHPLEENSTKTVSATTTIPCSNWQFLRYFLWLGTFGFGGPIALMGYMQRHLVEQKKWVTREDYIHGIALAQLTPGTVAAKVAIYLGWLRSKWIGATLVAIVFIAPSFFMVLAIAIFYTQYGTLPATQGIFYGVGAAVIAIILRSAFKLAQLTNTNNRVLWIICLINTAIVAFNEVTAISAFVLSGLAYILINSNFTFKTTTMHSFSLFPISQVFYGVIKTIAAQGTLIKMGLYFASAGAFVFGSGLAIIPFLHGGVVDQYHWLTEQQFIDAVAVAMITPGPAVITVAFIGYLVSGFAGATVAAVAVFIPCYLFVVLLAPFYHRIIQNNAVKAFVSGVTAAAAGAIIGSAYILGKRAIIDFPTAIIFTIALLCLVFAKKIPEPLLVFAAGLVGFLLKTSLAI